MNKKIQLRIYRRNHIANYDWLLRFIDKVDGEMEVINLEKKYGDDWINHRTEKVDGFWRLDRNNKMFVFINDLLPYKNKHFPRTNNNLTIYELLKGNKHDDLFAFGEGKNICNMIGGYVFSHELYELKNILVNYNINDEWFE